ncbi:DUF4149 domain-containing protein [Massilia violaceinigra]|uniref:DUF4149 domain-containing protein n=1 Tax=Massilia violaceinigra TaxID=2045208 RepID=A0ABY4A0U5_9BURK|nr:DUF4149 domain-containing protein [Massilia violaceinigra]UOD28375.1 DUF4149 domain-containing protein [Massilia violaceinigra]
MLLARALGPARLLLVTAWAGSLWTMGYLVAPTLFRTLSDSVLAGTIAGSMFRTEAIVSLVCGVGLLAVLALDKGIDAKRRRLLMLVVAGMLALQAVSSLGLGPMMAALKEAAPGGVMEAATRKQFGMLHGVSMVLFLAQSVLAAVLVFKNPR